ncbi:hypothetical protein FSP39_018871 [Pinctada imbricata]|uniref:Uncharacterized protein n=1 Tax=Pinctada imbricata TaxID=66713 RepID=A0AA89BQ72_PINIB|nr:hypothetical protein FSP39_018871 [Pinctada imbricata]
MTRDYLYNFEKQENVRFNEWDYVVFALTLVVSASIGLFYAIKDRKVKDENEFLLAGRQMQVFPVALSLLSSFISAITLLGTPAEVYTYNTMYWWISIGFLFTAMGAAHIFYPVFYRLQITSVFQYVEMRFGLICRFTACLMYLTWMLLYMAVVLYGPSLALNAVTGLDLWGSVVAVGLVCTFYTTLGGMKAVVWTDTFQMLVMFAGMLTLLIMGSLKLGGLDVAWDIANKNGRILFFDFDPDPRTRHTTWNVVVGGGMFWCAIYGINQAQVQRAMSVPSLKKCRQALWLNFPGMLLILSLVCTVGVVMYAYYAGCDPVTVGAIKKTDQLIPLFTMDLTGHLHGIPGLIMSCVFSGSLSTISSGLNAVAAVLLEDFLRPYIWKNVGPVGATIFSKITVIVVGVICLLLAFVVSEMGAILQLAYVLFGILGGPLLGLFTLGVLFPWANKWGGLVGHLTALGLIAWIGLGTTFNKVSVSPKSPLSIDLCRFDLMYNQTTATSLMTTTLAANLSTTTIPPATEEEYFPLYTMSYIWYTGLATLTTVVVGMVVSIITGVTDTTKLNPLLICPFFDVFMPFLPEKTRKKLRFGVPHGKDEFIKTFEEHVKHPHHMNGGVDNPGADISDVKLEPKFIIQSESTISPTDQSEKTQNGLDTRL